MAAFRVKMAAAVNACGGKGVTDPDAIIASH
jgi:hypothetical protein